MMAPPYKTGPIDDAEAWIIATPDATYAEAARMHGVTHNSLRARISNKYGSLAAARLMRDAGVLKPDAGRVLRPVRRCMRCGVSANIDHGLRMCSACRKEVAQLHDGGV
ncbi:hypothetical protein O4J55_10395 [Paracoccus sp. PXZ]